jgi:hypothetical protein
MDTNALFCINTRFRAAELLGALRLEPEFSVPALIQGMEATNLTVAMNCAVALGGFGGYAKKAVPVLTKAGGSTNELLSRFARQALVQIENSRE